MNLRTLKKLSKRAAALLPFLGDSREQFAALRCDNYASAFIGDRKHWERSPCHPTYEGRNDWSTASGAEIVFITRAGRTVVMRPPSHPRKGTVMVGAMSGYYEPEWDEETAWGALTSLVFAEFTDWGPEVSVLERDLGSPSEILRAAAELIERRRAEATKRAELIREHLPNNARKAA